MFEQLLKHLTQCHRMLLDSLTTLGRQSKLGEISETLAAARESGADLLKLVPAAQVNNFSDLDAIRQMCATTLAHFAEVQKLLEAERKALVKKKENPAAYRQVYSMAKLRKFVSDCTEQLQDVQINVDSATNLAQNAKQTTGDQRIKIETDTLIAQLDKSKDDPATRADLIAEFVNGLPDSKIVVLGAGFKGEFKELGLMLTQGESRTLQQMVRQRQVQDQDSKQVARENANLIRTDKQAKYVSALRAKYEPKLAAISVKEHGLQNTRAPLVVQTVQAMQEALWSKYGIKSEPFGYEKFTNNTYLLHDQLLLVFRKQDAKAFAQELLEQELDTDAQQQLKAVQQQMRKIDKAIADAEGAEHKRLVKQYQTLEARATDLNAQVQLAKAHAKTRNKLRTQSPDEEARDYAYHMLDLVNERSSVDYALVTVKFIRSIGNKTDYWAMWVLPKNVVKALRGTIGVTHDFCKSVKLPWL